MFVYMFACFFGGIEGRSPEVGACCTARPGNAMLAVSPRSGSSWRSDTGSGFRPPETASSPATPSVSGLRPDLRSGAGPPALGADVANPDGGDRAPSFVSSEPASWRYRAFRARRPSTHRWGACGDGPGFHPELVGLDSVGVGAAVERQRCDAPQPNRILHAVSLT
jgi:hypothetical protein